MRKIIISIVAIASALTLQFAPTPASAAVDCSKTTLRYSKAAQSKKNACVTQAQQYMKKAGIPVTVDGYFGNGTMNAILNFQRAQGLADDGVVGPSTWARLKSPRTVSKKLPASCRSYTSKRPVTLCGSLAQRKLFYLKNGTIVKTVNARFGGWAYNPKTKNYQIYRTTKGTHYVYAKNAKEYSEPYDAQMPYSIKFYGGEYVHYSSDFASNGYKGASHGCINIGSLKNAEWLFKNTPVGSKVVVY